MVSGNPVFTAKGIRVLSPRSLLWCSTSILPLFCFSFLTSNFIVFSPFHYYLLTKVENCSWGTYCSLLTMNNMISFIFFCNLKSWLFSSLKSDFCCCLLLLDVGFLLIILISYLMVLQEKWSKNLYIASICYGRTVC